MKKVKTQLNNFIILIIGFMITACMTYHDHIVRGNKDIILGFNQLEPIDEPFLVDVGHIYVRVVRDWSQFTGKKQRRPEVAGCGYIWKKKAQIEVLGRKLNGRVVFNPSNLGHELWDVLKHRDPRIADPHKIN
jgi:hypothetical protein